MRLGLSLIVTEDERRGWALFGVLAAALAAIAVYEASGTFLEAASVGSMTLSGAAAYALFGAKAIRRYLPELAARAWQPGSRVPWTYALFNLGTVWGVIWAFLAAGVLIEHLKAGKSLDIITDWIEVAAGLAFAVFSMFAERFQWWPRIMATQDPNYRFIAKLLEKMLPLAAFALVVFISVFLLFLVLAQEGQAVKFAGVAIFSALALAEFELYRLLVLAPHEPTKDSPSVT